MDNKNSYTPEEVDEIARTWSYLECQLVKYTMKLHQPSTPTTTDHASVCDAFKGYKRLPSNIRNLLDKRLSEWKKYGVEVIKSIDDYLDSDKK